jgi:NAD(P)-dependent dehydrogenase (short-subunit alcohol dehydrogenase family)
MDRTTAGDRGCRQNLTARLPLLQEAIQGLGLAIAKRFAREGAFVFITGRCKNELEKAAKLIGPEPAAIQAEASNLGDLDRVYEEIRSRKGRLDILVANAGGGSCRRRLRKP